MEEKCMNLFASFIVLAMIFAFTGISYASSAYEELNNCNNYMLAQDYKRAIEAGKKAVSLAPTNSDAHYCLGRNYRIVGELDQALNSLKKAESLTSDNSRLMFIYNDFGLIYERKRDFDNALFYFNNSLFISRNLRDKRAESMALNNLGIVYNQKGARDKALKFYELSLELETEEQAKAITYDNISLIYEAKGNRSKADEYADKAMEIRERTGDYHGSARRMIDKGELLLFSIYSVPNESQSSREERIKTGIKYLNEGLNRVQKVGDKYWEAKAYKILGRHYVTNEPKKTIDYYRKAYNIYSVIGANFEATVMSDVLKMLDDPVLLDDSKTAEERSMIMLEKTLGESHPFKK